MGTITMWTCSYCARRVKTTRVCSDVTLKVFANSATQYIYTDSENQKPSVIINMPCCGVAVPGADVQGSIDLEDPLDVQRLLSQPCSVGSAQKHRVSSHHC